MNNLNEISRFFWALALIVLLTITLIPNVAAQSSTVAVSGKAALPDNPGNNFGSTPAVDSGLDLSLAPEIVVTADGFESPFPNGRNYPDAGAFNAAFLNGSGDPIILSGDYPAERLCDRNQFWPCSTFLPIADSGTGGPLYYGTPGVHVSDLLPVPGGAVRLRYGHFDSGYHDNSGVMTVTTTIVSRTVDIDIKPGSDPNCFNINGHGVIPVAILGSDTFDVTSIDQGSLRFGGLEVRVRGKKGPLCNVDYSDSDAYLDLVCHFEDDADSWDPGDGEATLTGRLFDGTEFEGTDSICVVP